MAFGALDIGKGSDGVTALSSAYVQSYGSPIYQQLPRSYVPGRGLAPMQGIPHNYPYPGQAWTASPLSSGSLGPNGLWLPTDRAIRPPAGRQAPLYIENRSLSRNQFPYSAERLEPTSTRPSEIQNRFIPPVPAIARDARTLQYRVGSNDMYPRPHPNGGSSVRFQDLTRFDPASRDVAIDENNLPFVETARMTKIAEWGVMKIDNVSAHY